MGSIGQFIGHIIALNHRDLFSVRFSFICSASKANLRNFFAPYLRRIGFFVLRSVHVCFLAHSYVSSFSQAPNHISFIVCAFYAWHSCAAAACFHLLFIFFLMFFWLILLWYIKTLNNNRRLTDSIMHSLNVCQQWFCRSILRWHFERLYVQIHI